MPNDIDIICLQEVFDEKAWKILNQTLIKAGYNYFLYDPYEQFVKEGSLNIILVSRYKLYLGCPRMFQEHESTWFNQATDLSILTELSKSLASFIVLNCWTLVSISLRNIQSEIQNSSVINQHMVDASDIVIKVQAKIIARQSALIRSEN